MESNQVKYWFQQPNEIFNLYKYNKLIPKHTDEYPEKVNSIVRLSILIGLIVSLINLHIGFMLLPLTTMIITYIVYEVRKRRLSEMEEEFATAQKSDPAYLNISAPNNNIISSEDIDKLRKIVKGNQCTPPTKDNVFMNAMPYDDRNRYEACDQTEDKRVKAQMNAMFAILPHDSDDIFNRNDGRYGFHTMPSTTFPNDRDTFAHWAYDRGMTCKEGNGQRCYDNLHTELNSQLTGGGNACTGCNA